MHQDQQMDKEEAWNPETELSAEWDPGRMGSRRCSMRRCYSLPPAVQTANQTLVGNLTRPNFYLDASGFDLALDFLLIAESRREYVNR